MKGFGKGKKAGGMAGGKKMLGFSGKLGTGKTGKGSMAAGPANCK